MANLKKALALVLAAATAFTFAPVSTLFNAVDANAAASETTNLSSVKNKIDSQDLDGWYLENTANKMAVTTSSAEKGIWLKESKDKNGQVKAYAITIDRYNTSKDGITYKDLAEVTTAEGTSVTATTTTADAYKIDTANPEQTSKSTWVIKNETTSHEDVSSSDADFVNGVRNGGTYINFKKTDQTTDRDGNVFRGYKVNVTIQALANATDLDTVLETATYTITIGSNAETLTLDSAAAEVNEGKDVEITWTLKNKQDTKVIAAIGDGNIADDPTSTVISSNKSNVSGSLKFHGKTAGTKVYTVAGYTLKADGKTLDKQTTTPVTFTLTVNPRNSKLSVSYITEDGGARKTFTDDVTMASDDGRTVIKQDSLGDAGKDGNITFTAVPVTFKNNETVYYAPHNTITAGDIKAVTAATTSAEDIAKKISYKFKADPNVDTYDEDEMLPAAKLLTEDASGRKTVQITASYAAGQKVTYSIVAASKWCDDAVGKVTSGSTVTSRSYRPTQVNDPTHPFSSSNFDSYANYSSMKFGDAKFAGTTTTSGTTKVATGVAAGDTVSFTQDAATPYASVDQDGLVTIKNAVNAPNLYVVVYASKAQDNKIPASTYIIPIAIQSRAEVDFFATNTQQTADIDSAYAEENYVDLTDNVKGLSADTYKTFYLKKGESTKITPIGNVGASYITYSSDDESHATVVRNNDGSATVTAIKDTDPGKSVTITLKSSSSPEVEGLVNVTFKLVINELNVTAAPTSTGLTNGVTVGYGDPVKKIDTTIAGNTRSIVFDQNHVFEKVATSERPSGYKALKTSDPHKDDFTVTSTGTVVYNKNNGSGLLYVRCRYAADDKNNPSQWTYVPVHYGESESNNTMNVTTDVINVEVGKSQAIAVSGAAIDSKITYTSADPTVATVDANGNVTGVKAGQTRIAVYASATDKLNDKTVYVPVVVYEKGQNPDQPQVIDKVTKPTKVTGLKVKNKKGGKVTVSWTKQNQQNIKYYVKKTVGKKSAGKSVGSNKTTLSVKKGATVKVKVKAYIYNASGKKLVGSYSKTVTLKTDKK